MKTKAHAPAHVRARDPDAFVPPTPCGCCRVDLPLSSYPQADSEHPLTEEELT